MFEVLAAHLDVLVPPEQKTLIINACEALVLMGVTRHDDILDNELSVLDSIGNDVVLNMVDNTLIPLYRQTLGEFGVVLEDDVQLKYLTDILTGLVRIENWDDRQSVCDLCDTDEDADAILSDLLEMVGQYTSADYHSQLHSVKPELIERIVQNCTPVQYSELQYPEAIVAIARRRVSQFRQVFTHTDGPFDAGRWLYTQIADQGLRLGTPMTYLTQAHPLPGAVWDSKRFSDLAEGLLAQVAASDVPPQQEVEVMCLYAEPHMADTAAMITFRHAALQAYHQYQAAGAT